MSGLPDRRPSASLSAAITSAIGTLPFLGPAYEDDSGKVDIHLVLSTVTMLSQRES